jgi:hypothetical protein
MKITKFLMVFLLLIPFLQACQGDITDLADPRDAVTKLWRVTETGQSYDCTITKDANESTRVIFSNFHNLGSVTTTKVYATLAGKTLTIPTQVIDAGDYTISNGVGTISSDLKDIDFTYTVQPGADPSDDFTANFGEVQTVKKKTVKPTL